MLEKNLGILVRIPQAGKELLQTDKQAAVFWVQHPDNVLRDNAAAGSEGMGIWYDLPEQPTGLSSASPLRPRTGVLGEFTRNVTHSNAMRGLTVDDLQSPQDAVFSQLTSYKNRGHAAWMSGNQYWQPGSQVLSQARIADSLMGCFFPGKVTLQNSLLIGETANKGNPKLGDPVGLDGRSLPQPGRPGAAVLGVNFYDGPATVKDTTFVNFQGNAQREAGALSFNVDLADPMFPLNSAERVTFVNSKPVYVVPMPQPPSYIPAGVEYRYLQFRDADGSVTGQPDSFVMTRNPLLQTAASVEKPEWNAMISPVSFSYNNLNAMPLPGVITRDDGVSMPFKLMGTIPNRAYTLNFSSIKPTTVSAYIGFLRPGTWLRFSFPYPHQITKVTRDGDGQPLKTAASLAELDASQGEKYFYDAAQRMIHLKIFQRDNGTMATRVDVTGQAVSGGQTNLPPTVALTKPVAGAAFQPSAAITLEATAADADGSVSKVEFFAGATKLGEDTSAPFSFTWSNVSAGVYTLTARATDSGGAVTTSAAVTIQVQSGQAANRPPVAVIGGLPGTLQAGATGETGVTLSGAASSDPDGDALSFQWFDNGTPFSTTASASRGLSVGAHTITLIVSDGRGGASTATQTVNVTPAAPGTQLSLSISSITPASGWRGRSSDVVITGTGFEVGASVSFSGSGVTATVLSATATELVVRVGVSGNAQITSTPSTRRSITVTNPSSGAQVTLPEAFTVLWR